MTTTVEGLQTLKLEQLHESPWNPRKFFDQAKLTELADSIKANGIIEPLLARPNARGFELAAGHRRYRAAKLAGLFEAPVIIRAMSDVQFLEVLMIDNLQREDLTALEEAEGYQALMTKGKYTVQRLAERIGRSEKYVYDRVKLLQLIAPAAKLLRQGTITAGHAILLARLKPKDQERAIDPEARALLEGEGGLFHPDNEGAEEDRYKARSVREFQGWIDEHVRFAAGAADPMLFPETVATVTTAKENAEKIIPITHEHYIQQEARAEERTFGPRSWKRADGRLKSKECEYSAVGVVVVGGGRGEAYRVCVNRDKCKVHWGAEQREKARRSTSTSGGGSSHAERQLKEQQQQSRADALEESRRAQYRKAKPAILEAIAEKVKKAPIGRLADLLIGSSSDSKRAAEWVSRGSSADDLVRHLAFMEFIQHDGDYTYARQDLTNLAKSIGVDVKKILEAEAPAKEAKGKKK